MSELERSLRELKPYAQERLFADWGVTPELKAKLADRLGADSEEPPMRPRPSWTRYLAVAVLAVALVGVVGGEMNKSPQSPLRMRREAPSNQSAHIPDPWVSTAPVGRPVDVIPVHGAPTQLVLNVSDANGALVSTTIADVSFSRVEADTAHSAAKAAAPPQPTGIPGVEVQPGQKVVLNAEYTLQVTDADAAVAQLQQLTVALHGYIVEASVNTGADGSKAGRMVLRIPSGSYNGAVDQIRSLGKLRHERQWSQDVTYQYQDQERRIQIMLEQEEKLQELSLKAATFEEWLTITKQINETRAQVEQMQGHLKRLENQIEYSTFNLQLHQPAPGQAAVTDQPGGLLSQMGQAFSNSLLTLREFGWRLSVGVAGALPLLVPGAGLLGIGLAAYRRYRRRMAD